MGLLKAKTLEVGARSMKYTLLLAAPLTLAAVTLAAPAHADVWDFDTCPSGHEGVVDGSPTTCPFAENVRDAWYADGQPLGSPFVAYSPVTGGRYVMTCYGKDATDFGSGGPSIPSTRCVDSPDTGVKVVIW